MTTAYFTGECRWAKVYKPSEKYQKYEIDVLLDVPQYEEFSKFKFKTPGKMENGKFWVTMRRKVEDGAPKVIDKDGKPLTTPIGNGSTVTVKIETYKYDNAYGKGQGFKIDTICVDNLVIYDPEKKTEVGSAPQAAPAAPPSSPTRPRILF